MSIRMQFLISGLVSALIYNVVVVAEGENETLAGQSDRFLVHRWPGQEKAFGRTLPATRRTRMIGGRTVERERAVLRETNRVDIPTHPVAGDLIPILKHRTPPL